MKKNIFGDSLTPDDRLGNSREFRTRHQRINWYIALGLLFLIGFFLSQWIAKKETQASQVALSNHKAFVYQHPWWKIK